MSNASTADALAKAALEIVKPGMLIGVGGGRTTARIINALGAAASDQNLGIRVAAGSEATEELCKQHGLETVDFSSVESLDLLIDGADEVDRDMCCLKGSGGAVTRERMLAWASRATIYMVGEQKVSKRVGDRATLAVAVMAFGLASTRAALRDLGVNGVVRRDMQGHFFVTDNGNLILDVTINETEDLRALAGDLDAIPGVIDHGLFLDEADTLLIEREDGTIETLTRA